MSVLRAADGYFAIYWHDGFHSVPIAILFLFVGFPLIALRWKGAPFRLFPCAAVSAACGTVAFYLIGLGLSDPDDYAYFQREGLLFDYYLGVAALLAIGALAGLAGGMTFWQVCRLGARAPV